MPIIWLVIYLLFILYITLYSRNFSLIQSSRMEFFWSYKAWLDGKSGNQILLNIALFVPLGFFLSNALQCLHVKQPRLWSVVVSFVVTVSIEAIQYVDGLGLCEFDDVFNNALGAWIGTYIFTVCHSLDEQGQRSWHTKLVTILFLFAGLVGCQMTGPGQLQQPYKQFMEYDFALQNVASDGNNLILDGYCRAYGRGDMPRYQIVLKSEKSGKLYKADTMVDGHIFRAVVPSVPDEKVEVDIRFKYYSPVSTFSYISKGRVEDVGGNVPEPDVEGTDLSMIVNYGVLKAYEPSCYTYVYQFGNRLYWLIGSVLDKQTTVLCYLYTNEPDKLPEKMRKYKCDIQNFRAGAKNEMSRTMRCGRYRVFYRDLPAEYNVTCVRTGFYAEKKTKWQKYFRVGKENT